MKRNVEALVFFLCTGAYTLVLAWIAWDIGLLSDDWWQVGLTERSLLEVFTSNLRGKAGEGGFYRPLLMLSYKLDHLLSGGSAAWQHLHNVLLHACAAALVFSLANKMFGPRQPWSAAVAGWLFLVLPVHTDSIFWVSGRSDTLCAVFYLLALSFFVDFAQGARARRGLLALLCCFGAFLVKEMALSLPAVLLCVALAGRWRKQRRVWLLVLGVFICTGLYFVLRRLVLGSVLDSAPNTNLYLERVLDSLRLAASNVLLTDRPFVIHGLMAVSAIAVARGLFRRTLNPVMVLLVICLYLVSLAPVLGLIMPWYLYIPSAFACLLVVPLFWHPGRASHLMTALKLALIGLVASHAVTLCMDGMLWRAAGRISEDTLAAVEPYTRRPGRLFLMNVPSAYGPEGALAAKPLFAYNLARAIKATFGKRARAWPIVVNHIQLREVSGGQASALPLNKSAVMVKTKPGVFFTFHTAEFIAGKLPPMKTWLRRPWGSVHVINRRRLIFRFEPRRGDRVLMFDGQEWLPAMR